MRGAWISGWGVAPERLRPLAERLVPGATHCFLPPVTGSLDAIEQVDFLVGWSLGALLLLRRAAEGATMRRALLLAPFGGFCLEHGMGGVATVTQVRWLQRWMTRDPAAALNDFYSRAGLGHAPQQFPYEAKDLHDGLSLLIQEPSPELRQFCQRGLPEGWIAAVGEHDSLLDPAGVCAAIKGCRLVPDAGHAIENFAPVIKEFAHAL